VFTRALFFGVVGDDFAGVGIGDGLGAVELDPMAHHDLLDGLWER
jgi:hypothetical protein